jgi:hypothetical protein
VANLATILVVLSLRVHGDGEVVRQGAIDMHIDIVVCVLVEGGFVELQWL